MLEPADIEAFRSSGYLLVPGVVGGEDLSAMRQELAGWIEESRTHRANYGVMARNKLRFDLEPGHSAEVPRLRRVANPVDISPAYRRVLWEGPIPELVGDLIGPDVKFHHCKLNIKLPGMKTFVGWHQDHPFDPHTNDDIVVALVLLDDMNVENGCLYVVPGSHRQKFTHYRGDDFVGETPAELAETFARDAVPIIGRAGDLCLIDTWMVHGSPANLSSEPRRMLICDYTAADAFPLTLVSVPSTESGRILKGQKTRIARFRAGAVELPPAYEADSFFTLQNQGVSQ